MPDIKLPKKLSKEPLVEALFELRFEESPLPLSKVLPGLLVKDFKSMEIKPLAASDVPENFRRANPEFKFAPVLSIELEKYLINLSDYTVAVTCKYPYPGWGEFQPMIMKLFKSLSNQDFIQASTIERYSMKYVDLIEAEKREDQLGKLDIDFRLADYSLDKEDFQIRFEKSDNNYTHIITLASSAIATFSNQKRKGLIIDIDTIKDCQNTQFNNIEKDFEDNLEKIHTVNKKEFFKALKPETVDSLEPVYD